MNKAIGNRSFTTNCVALLLPILYTTADFLTYSVVREINHAAGLDIDCRDEPCSSAHPKDAFSEGKSTQVNPWKNGLPHHGSFLLRFSCPANLSLPDKQGLSLHFPHVILRRLGRRIFPGLAEAIVNKAIGNRSFTTNCVALLLPILYTTADFLTYSVVREINHAAGLDIDCRDEPCSSAHPKDAFSEGKSTQVNPWKNGLPHHGSFLLRFSCPANLSLPDKQGLSLHSTLSTLHFPLSTVH